MKTPNPTPIIRLAALLLAAVVQLPCGAQSPMDILGEHDPQIQFSIAPSRAESGIGGGVVNGTGVRLRAWPVDGTIMATPGQWDKVTILGKEGDWYKVIHNGRTGYIGAKYVTLNSMPPYIETAKMSPDAFFRKLAPMCESSMKRFGVPISVTLAQAALECGWGSNYLAVQANNLFSVKGKGPAGSVTIVCDEYFNGKHVYILDDFRKYNSWEESVLDHAKFLKNNKRYAEAFKYTGAGYNPNMFASAIHRAGYATDPKYTSLLVDMMKRYNLYKYDKPSSRS